MMISSTFWGKLSDRFGRKRALIISGIFLFFYGFLSTFSPSYGWILCLRFMVGFNIGCVPQVSCGWWRAGHVTQSSPLIGPGGRRTARPERGFMWKRRMGGKYLKLRK